MTRLLMIAVFTIVALVGCAFSDTHAVVALYCKAPETGRVLLRTQIAHDTAPNKIRVECAADGL